MLPTIQKQNNDATIDNTESSIKVTIPFKEKRRFEEAVDNSAEKLVDILSKTELAVLKAIASNPRMSQSEIAKLIGIGKTSVQTAIVRLKKLGLIVRHDSNKTGYWEVTDS